MSQVAISFWNEAGRDTLRPVQVKNANTGEVAHTHVVSKEAWDKAVMSQCCQWKSRQPARDFTFTIIDADCPFGSAFGR